MNIVGQVLTYLLYIFLLFLIGRLILEVLQSFARQWRPRGVVLVIAEATYTITDPPLKLLELGLRLADGQLFGVATVHPHEMTGWAAATKALDLATGERHPGVPPAIEEALQDLYDAGYNGYARQRERFFAAKYFPPIDILMEAGYDVDFVKSYLVVLGKSSSSVERIDKLYVPPSQRPRTSG